MWRARSVVIVSLVSLTLAGAAAAHPTRRTSLQSLPFMGSEPSPSVFGLNTGTYDSNHASFVKDIPTAASLGARWVHFTMASIHWDRFGRPQYGVLDYEITQAKRHGLGVLVSLGGAPSACSLKPRPADVDSCPPVTARDLRAYQVVLGHILRRYRNVVDWWESWLEPNHRSFWPSGPNPAQYARLLRAEHQEFATVNRADHVALKLLFAGPSDFSIIPGSPGGTPVLPYVHSVLSDLDGARVFNAIALHAYRFPPATTGPATADWDSVAGIPAAPGASGPYPNQGCRKVTWCQMTWPQELSAYEQEFENHGYGQMPLWLTEFGWSGNAVAAGDYYPSYSVQASYLSQAYEDLLRLPFVQAAFWFNLRDYQPTYDSPDPAFFAHYGLLQYGFAPKPAAIEFRHLAQAHTSAARGGR